MKIARKLIASAIALSLATLSLTAFASQEAPTQWNYDNTVLVSVDPDTQDIQKTYTPEDFPEAAVSDVRIFYRDESALALLLLLDAQKQQTVAEACEKLKENEALLYARDNYFAEHPHSASLNQTAASIKVGESISLQCIAYDLGVQSFCKDRIEVSIPAGTYEEGKIYTPADFSEYDLAKVEQSVVGQDGDFLLLTMFLKTDDYSTLTAALSQAGQDDRFCTVSSVFPPSGARAGHHWSVSDASVLSFDSDLESDAVYYNGQAVSLTAKQAGTATVTLVLGYASQEPVTVSCEITVIADETTTEIDSTTPVTGTTQPSTQPSTQNQNPDTGDTSISLAVPAIAMLLVGAAVIPTLRSRQKSK